MLCPRCGRTVTQLHSGVCIECLFSLKKPVHLPEKIEMVICGDCGSLFIGKHWEKIRGDDALRKLIQQHIGCAHGFHLKEMVLSCEELNGNRFSCRVKLLVEYEGEKHEIESQVAVLRRKNVCPDCSRIHAHGYSAIIQIRRKGRKIEPKLLREMEELVGSEPSEIVKREVVENGIDLYIAGNNYARAVCEELKQRYGARVKASPKLHTRKDGRDVYRVTYLVELDRFEDGDLLYYDGELYTVIDEKGEKLHIQSQNGKERAVNREFLKNVEIIDFKMLEEVRVVYMDSHEITVLDERTMRLEKIENIDYPADAERVWILKREDNIYLVPLRSVKKMGGDTG
ncbi:MAG: 60S ribosomal export protein NMD3 [Thermoplasmata archaeon]